MSRALSVCLSNSKYQVEVAIKKKIKNPQNCDRPNITRRGCCPYITRRGITRGPCDYPTSPEGAVPSILLRKQTLW